VNVIFAKFSVSICVVRCSSLALCP